MSITFLCNNCQSTLSRSKVLKHRCKIISTSVSDSAEFDDGKIPDDVKLQTEIKSRVKKTNNLYSQKFWNEIVTAILANHETSDENLKIVIAILKDRINIPQKKQKFVNYINYITSSKRVPDCAQILWDIISLYNLKARARINESFDQTTKPSQNKRKYEEIDTVDSESEIKKVKTDDGNLNSNKELNTVENKNEHSCEIEKKNKDSFEYLKKLDDSCELKTKNSDENQKKTEYASEQNTENSSENKKKIKNSFEIQITNKNSCENENRTENTCENQKKTENSSEQNIENSNKYKNENSLEIQITNENPCEKEKITENICENQNKTENICENQNKTENICENQNKDEKPEFQQIPDWRQSVIQKLENYQSPDDNLNILIKCLKNRRNIPHKPTKFANYLNTIPQSRKVPNCCKIIWNIISNTPWKDDPKSDDLKNELKDSEEPKIKSSVSDSDDEFHKLLKIDNGLSFLNSTKTVKPAANVTPLIEDYPQKKTRKPMKSQKEWHETVIKCLNEYKTSDMILQMVINQLKTRKNFPQKFYKFNNFVDNISLSKNVPKCAEILWDIISSIDAKQTLNGVSNIESESNGKLIGISNKISVENQNNEDSSTSVESGKNVNEN